MHSGRSVEKFTLCKASRCLVILLFMFVWSCGSHLPGTRTEEDGGRMEPEDSSKSVDTLLDRRSSRGRGRLTSRRPSRYPYAQWMGANEATRFLTPAQFCFPGTHHSGAYKSPKLGPVVSADRLANSRLRFQPRYRSAAARWSVTQPGSNILSQLLHGARYVDLRVAAYSFPDTRTTYYLANRYAMSLLADALRDILIFISKHPTELIIMSVRPTYNVNDHTLSSLIEKILGKWMYPNMAGNSSFSHTIDEILKSRKHIIGVYQLQKQKMKGRSKASKPLSHKWFAHDELFFSPQVKLTADVRTVKGKQAYLKKQIGQFINWTTAAHLHGRSSKMFLLQYTLPYTRSMSTSTHSSLMTLASRFNPTLESFISKQLSRHQRAAINVITADHFTTSRAVSIAHRLLRERTAVFQDSTKKPAERKVPSTTHNPSPSPESVTTQVHANKNMKPSSSTDAKQHADTTNLLAGSGLVVALLVVVYYLKLQ